jgi:Lon-like protease
VADTQTSTLVVDDADPSRAVRPPSTRQRWWAVPLTVLAFGVILTIALAGVLPADVVAEKENARSGETQATPYARTPGSAQAVKDRITFGELGDVATQHPPDGDIYFVTVSEPSQSVLSWWVGDDEPAVQFLTEEEKFGVTSPEQRRVVALEQMRTASQVAQYVALRAVGFDVDITPGDVLIQEMVCLEVNDEGTDCAVSSPSDQMLDPGDRIVRVDGVTIDGVEDLSQLLVDKEPGDTVEITLDRPQVGELTVTVELTVSPTEPDRTIIGFVPFDTRRVELPFELDIDTGEIGGPSAGLAFTLTLIDELTEGELTGDRSIAVTGTIELDGSVGPIGGLAQKASAVDQAGVDVFIVPAAQGEEDIARAREAAPDMEIIPVATLDEALAALEELGGDPVDAVPIATNAGS